MKGLMTTVTNVTTGKRYFVSTVDNSGSKYFGYQTAVFRKRFGPLANFKRPQAFFLGDHAAYLHGRVTALVRDVDPANWPTSVTDIVITAEGDEVDAKFDAMMARLRGGPAATE